MPTFDTHGMLVSGEWQLVIWVVVCCLLFAYGVRLARGPRVIRAGAGTYESRRREPESVRDQESDQASDGQHARATCRG